MHIQEETKHNILLVYRNKRGRSVITGEITAMRKLYGELSREENVVFVADTMRLFIC
jgi:hypothetical protein